MPRWLTVVTQAALLLLGAGFIVAGIAVVRGELVYCNPWQIMTVEDTCTVVDEETGEKTKYSYEVRRENLLTEGVVVIVFGSGSIACSAVWIGLDRRRRKATDLTQVS